MATDDDEPKVKDVLEGRVPLDPQTEADLMKWFGLPSVTELEEQGKQAGPVDDSEMAEVIARRDKVLASIDPALVDAIRLRTEDVPNPIGIPKGPPFSLMIDETGSEMPFFDHGMVDRASSIADPREVEIPDALIDALKECTPQALLRDLHRPELYFDKTFEIVDPVAAERIDIVHEVKTAMRTSWKLPAFGRTPLDESREMLSEVRTHRRRSWLEYLPQLPNRSVQE